MRKRVIDKWYPLTILVVAIVLVFARDRVPFEHVGGILDGAMLVAVTALIVWLVWPRAKTKG